MNTMNRIGLFFFCMLIVGNCDAQAKKHVVLISIDGLRPEMYLTPSPSPSGEGSWPTPNLQLLMKQGVYAKHMKSVFPSYTYPSHVAMLTGALPARSGICYNAPIGSKGDWNWFTKDIEVPTLWQVLKKLKMTSSAIEWPVSVGPEITYNIPEIWSKENPDDRITEVRKYATKGLIEEIEANATDKLDSSNMTEENFSLAANSARMAAYIFKKYQPNLMALHFAEVDGFEHGYGREGDSVRMAVAAVDKAIGEVMNAIEESGLKNTTTVLIVGDHGFSDIHEAIYPNTWLANKGLKGYLFQPAGGSAFLYHEKSMVNGQWSMVNDEDLMMDSVRGILNALPDSTKKLFRVIEKKELIKMGADKNAVLALAAVPGIVFGGASDKLTKAVSGGHHGYDPNLPEMYTGFIAAGAGINKVKVIDELCVTDVAPLIAKLLGIEFNCPDGRLIKNILK
ncbi:MAG: ectonucleotide pyrophosphatase/phosphodiesterase [Chitinophagaceae bacterium]